MATALSTPVASADPLARIAEELQRDPRLKSTNTRRGYLADLAQFETWRAGRPLTKLLVESYASELQAGGRSPTTINRKLAAIRWWARRLADLADDDLEMPSEFKREIVKHASRVASVGDVHGQRAPKGRHLAAGELMALLEGCARDESPAGVRDAALIALAWATGMRRSELAGLRRADFVQTGAEEGAPALAGELMVHGKGDKVRVVYLYDGAAAYLLDWLKLRGLGEGPLFLAVNKGGAILAGSMGAPHRGISDEALAQMLEKRRVQAGLRRLTWHDFRRTFAGNLLDNGNDLVTVQKLMGHASPTTTAAYDRRGEEVKRRASRSLHVPYPGGRAK